MISASFVYKYIRMFSLPKHFIHSFLNVQDLSIGIVGGVAGVFIKPYEGATQEGVGGFFKGVGKGVAGLVTRPTGGIIDFASGTFDTVKRATEVGDQFTRVRPAR